MKNRPDIIIKNKNYQKSRKLGIIPIFNNIDDKHHLNEAKMKRGVQERKEEIAKIIEEERYKKTRSE